MLLGVGFGVGVEPGQPLPGMGNDLPCSFTVHLFWFFFGFAFGIGPIMFHSWPVNCGLGKLCGVRFANSAWANVFQMFAGQ